MQEVHICVLAVCFFRTSPPACAAGAMPVQYINIGHTACHLLQVRVWAVPLIHPSKYLLFLMSVFMCMCFSKLLWLAVCVCVNIYMYDFVRPCTVYIIVHCRTVFFLHYFPFFIFFYASVLHTCCNFIIYHEVHVAEWICRDWEEISKLCSNLGN